MSHTKISSTMPWAMAKDGSFPFGARVCRAGDLQEKLDHEDEDVEVLRDHRGVDVDAAPAAGHVLAVERKESDREQAERQDPHFVGGQQVIEGEAEAGDARQNGRDQKERVPAAEPAVVERCRTE
jgi:hypothetical protein